MRKKTQDFFGAFAITVILIGELCGFVAVDLSTDRYMPDKFGPFFEITAIEYNGVNFNFLAGNYRMDLTLLQKFLGGLSNYRGLLPNAPRVSAAIAAWGAGYILDQIDTTKPY